MAKESTEMERLQGKDFHPEVFKLFDRYIHGFIDRREFLDSVSKYAVGGMTAAGILAAFTPNYALGQRVNRDDRRVTAEYVSYASPLGNETTRGYLARPAGALGKLPGILVIHENRGLNPHIEDVARRAMLENYLVFAPDALAPMGGYHAASGGDEAKAAEAFGKLDATRRTEDFIAAANFLQNHPFCTGRIGAVGFCFGGGVVNTLAVRFPALVAAVPYYGGQPAAGDVPKINAALLIHYAEMDERINAGWPAYETALKAAGKKYEAFFYPGTQHGFNNDTGPRYHKEGADLAWQRTLDHFKKHLQTS